MTVNVIAIDGPVGSGKSTVARALASKLNWSFLDTGAMYRALTVEAFERGLDLADEEQLDTLAREAQITTLPRVVVNGRDVTNLLRTEQINRGVSIVAAQARVRTAMVRQQREFALTQPRGTVVEGRDITTVVFPDARLKIFLTATLSERTRRRVDEDEISIQRRDATDSEREISPLRQAADAKIVDTTGRSVDDVVKEILLCLATR